MGSTRRIRAVGLVLAAATLTAACARKPAAAPGPNAAASLTGTILGTGRPFGQGLFAYALPHLRARELAPRSSALSTRDFLGFDYLGAFWGPARGHALAFFGVDETRARLYDLSVGGDSEPVGPPLRFVSGFTVRGNLVVATTCAPDRVLVLDLEHPRAWREVARSCVAAPSPSGDRVAFVKGGSEVWATPVDGGEPERLADVGRLGDLRDVGIGRVQVVFLAWGEGGLAIQVADPESLGAQTQRNAIVVRREDGRIEPVPVAVQPLSLAPSPWQPGGPLLAFLSFPTSGGANVRLFDPRTGRVSVVATDAQWFGGVAWSPDGRALVATTSTNALLFFDRRGRWIRRVGAGGVGLFDWGP